MASGSYGGIGEDGMDGLLICPPDRIPEPCVVYQGPSEVGAGVRVGDGVGVGVGVGCGYEESQQAGQLVGKVTPLDLQENVFVESMQ